MALGASYKNTALLIQQQLSKQGRRRHFRFLQSRLQQQRNNITTSTAKQERNNNNNNVVCDNNSRSLLRSSPPLSIRIMSNNNNNSNQRRHNSSSTSTDCNEGVVEEKEVSSLLLSSLPTRYLRELAPSEFDETTFQRKNVLFDTHSGKPISPSNTNNNNKYTITDWSLNEKEDEYIVHWGDGVTSHYSKDFIKKEVSKVRWNHHQQQQPAIIIPEESSATTTSIIHDAKNRVLWSHLTEEDVRHHSSALSLDFRDSLSNEGMSQMLGSLYKYGILLITNTPVNDGGSGVAALAAALSGGAVKEDSSNTSLLARYLEDKETDGVVVLPHGTDGPLRTLYGTVWSTESSGQAEGASVADSAYGSDGLPLHTDMTYYRDPPGLQIFTMKQPSAIGGESVFGDGYAVAQRLRNENPEAFRILTQTMRRYRSIDTNLGWHLEAYGPVISTTIQPKQQDNNNHEQHAQEVVTMIRHNDLDRMPDLPPPPQQQEQDNEDKINLFYQQLDMAHKAWDSLLAKDEFRLTMGLRSGDTVVVANQRCFHGRRSFQNPRGGTRSVIGCYVSQDDLYSRMRVEGYDV